PLGINKYMARCTRAHSAAIGVYAGDVVVASNLHERVAGSCFYNFLSAIGIDKCDFHCSAFSVQCAFRQFLYPADTIISAGLTEMWGDKHPLSGNTNLHGIIALNDARFDPHRL